MGTRGTGLKPKTLLHAFKDPHNYNSRNPNGKKTLMTRFFLTTEIIWNVILFIGLQSQTTSKELKKERRSAQAIITENKLEIKSCHLSIEVL